MLTQNSVPNENKHILDWSLHILVDQSDVENFLHTVQRIIFYVILKPKKLKLIHFHTKIHN